MRAGGAGARCAQLRRGVRAVTLQEPGTVRVEEVAPPRLEAATDALVRVTLTAICGSDLHVFHGDIPGVEPGSVMGHEFVGVVEETGEAVRRFREGDRVVGTFHTACGSCEPCRRGDQHQCRESGVYGYGIAFGDLRGVQAERARVPHADVNLRAVPGGLSDEAALFAGDVLSTAYGAVRKAGLSPGESCAVIGCGPVGLLAVECALLSGASRVYALDLVEERVRAAEERGAVGVHGGRVNPVSKLQELTGGTGADVVIEAVGSTETLSLAFDLVRDAGRISAVGVTVDETLDFPLMSCLVRDLTFRIGLANVHREIDTVLRLVAGDRVDPTRLVSHRLSLEEAPEGYRLFADREATKVVLEPAGAGPGGAR